MTREKKELIKKIDKAQMFLDCEVEMGCGFMPSEMVNNFFEENINPLYEKLAELSHYSSVEEMLHDERGNIY